LSQNLLLDKYGNLLTGRPDRLPIAGETLEGASGENHWTWLWKGWHALVERKKSSTLSHLEQEFSRVVLRSRLTNPLAKAIL